ncbi:hypothetical protein ACK4QF_20175 [Proteus mirabilis]|uniref:hypothetical protein n=2 Tax=Proteus mirabilis TaxID=584 RepID=UPI0022A2DE42|nr:hypothetical protein [Proteus mirabilis]HDA9904138.1 hypothetical protein [Proteus mirabilis]HEH4197107.1 hypothetical protein [Proteus mirabilis]HEH4212884.1 hypothetical protein [Proteus mirabilis]HEH4265681.1 hypothetical protein [Proteus mirabilis]
MSGVDRVYLGSHQLIAGGFFIGDRYVMSDKKEIGELIYKVSVDTSDLDKLEEQLIRIKQLMEDVGVKPKSIPPFFFQSSGEFFIKDAFINSAEFKGLLVSNKSEQSVNAQLADLRMRADRQDNDIAELIRLRQADQQAWSDAINRTWCSQR